MRKDTSANTLHIWTSRTGCHTIESAMKAELGANNWSSDLPNMIDNWRSVEDIKDLPENDMWKFAFVRNPWDREYSVYSHVQKTIANTTNTLTDEQKDVAGGVTFDEWLTFKYSSDIDTPLISGVERVADAEKFAWANHKGTQTGQIYYANGSLGVNEVCYYEDFVNEWNTKIASVKGYTANVESITKYASGVYKANTDYRNVYSEAGKQLISNYYADDIANFGYNYNDGPNVKPTVTIPATIDVSTVTSGTRFANNHYANVDVISLLGDITSANLHS